MKNIWFATFWIIVGIVLTVGLQNFFKPVSTNQISNNSSDNSGQIQGISNNNPANNPSNLPASTTIDDDPYLGDKSKAKLAIVEFSDYECPFCQRFHKETFDQIVKEYVDTGKAIIVYRDFPLDFHNPAATNDASAANCIKEIDGDKKYFEMMGLIFERGGLNGVGITKEKFYQLAAEIGTDLTKFRKCLNSDKFQEEIQKDLADGQTAGIDGTPGFVIGKLKSNGEVEGELVSGAQPLAVFQDVIERQLKNF